MEWNRFDLGRALRLLHHPDVGVVRRTLRMLHIRMWHAPSKRMIELLKSAGAPSLSLQLVPQIVDTCRACRTWTRPGPRSIATSHLAKSFNEMVQWDALFMWDDAISHCIDEAIRWTAAVVLKDSEATTVITPLMESWVRPYGPMKLLVTDREGLWAPTLSHRGETAWHRDQAHGSRCPREHRGHAA